jgi:hypothetical protein
MDFKNSMFALLKSPATTHQLWIWRQTLVTDETCYIMTALEFTFNTFSNGWKRKKEIQNMLTYLLILFYTLTCYFHREKCFEFEGNVYDLFFICKGIISEMDKKKNLPPLFGRCISSLFYSDLLKTILQSLQQCIVCFWKHHLAYMYVEYLFQMWQQ